MQGSLSIQEKLNKKVQVALVSMIQKLPRRSKLEGRMRSALKKLVRKKVTMEPVRVIFVDLNASLSDLIDLLHHSNQSRSFDLPLSFDGPIYTSIVGGNLETLREIINVGFHEQERTLRLITRVCLGVAEVCDNLQGVMSFLGLRKGLFPQ